MPSRRGLGRAETAGIQQMPMSALGFPEAEAPLSDGEMCERAVRAIWHRLDEHELVDEHVRADLAAVLEPLTSLGFGDRPQRLINTLRLPDPIDAAQLYWLTRRLLTLVPELQAAAAAFSKSHSEPPSRLT